MTHTVHIFAMRDDLAKDKSDWLKFLIPVMAVAAYPSSEYQLRVQNRRWFLPSECAAARKPPLTQLVEHSRVALVVLLMFGNVCFDPGLGNRLIAQRANRMVRAIGIVSVGKVWLVLMDRAVTLQNRPADLESE
jgi:hypothetical protein